MPRLYGELTKLKDDLLLFSKHADVAFKDGEGNFALFWFNTPKRGKCLSVECNTDDYPAVLVTILANWKNRRCIEKYRRDGWEESVF